MTETNYAERLRRASEGIAPPGSAFEGLRTRRDRRHRRERATSLAVGAALTIAIVAGGVFAVHATRSTSLGPETGALGAAVAPSLQPGRYVYRQQVIVFPVCRVVITTWWAGNDSGRIAASMTNPRRCPYGLPHGGVFGPGRFPWDSSTKGLSTDVATLFTQMEHRTSPSGSSPEPAFSPGPVLAPGVTAGSLWASVVNLLEDPNSPPDLYAALSRVAAQIPGVRVLSGVHDPDGRPAVAVVGGSGTPVVAWTAYFDPRTGQLMAENGPPSDPGSTITYYSEGIVRSTSAVPSGDQWLFRPAHK
jgi:hypothetical protein